MKKYLTSLLAFVLLIPLLALTQNKTEEPKDKEIIEKQTIEKEAIFAAGCFWCIEAAFDEVDGVISTTSGYTGGKEKNPNYYQVSSGSTGHIEALKVVYDASKTNYEKLLKHFWKNTDPLEPNGQFCDKGTQYQSAIFVANQEQKKLANQSFEKVKKLFEEQIETKILDLGEFYEAEKYHQDYHNKNKIRYKFYSSSCGRASRLEKVWKEKEL